MQTKMSKKYLVSCVDIIFILLQLWFNLHIIFRSSKAAFRQTRFWLCSRVSEPRCFLGSNICSYQFKRNQFHRLPSAVQGVAKCTRQVDVNTTVGKRQTAEIICQFYFCQNWAYSFLEIKHETSWKQLHFPLPLLFLLCSSIPLFRQSQNPWKGSWIVVLTCQSC